MHTAFVILLLFAVGSPERARDANQTIRCASMHCVEKVLAAAAHSTRLARLRVYRGDPGDLGNGKTVQLPFIDDWLS